MKTCFTFLVSFLLVQYVATAQQPEGVVTYERRQHWDKILSRLSYLSQEEKDRIVNTWKNVEEDKSKWMLYFSPTQSLYTYANQGVADEAGGYSKRKEDYSIYRNFDRDQKTDLIETLGKTYIVEDSLHTPAWKILNQIKEVAGYVCMKAVTTDPIQGQTITAWFSMDLPSQAGPERYFGLPGVILELCVNDGEVVVEAIEVTLRSVSGELIVPTAKGKRISDTTYNNLLKNHITQSIKAQRNPYWTIRY